MVKRLTLFVFILISLSAAAQEFYVKQFGVDDGLPADVIKACSQDSLGYFWIATDEGLVKFDGITFTTYRKEMHSNYFKGFSKTRKGKLYAFGDLDFFEIRNLGDTVLFKKVCPVSNIENDTTLSYPKLVYEDVEGSLWISESQAVVRISKGSFKRYEFDITNRTPVFLRSFQIFEDQNKDLYVTSFQGNVFKYNAEIDGFVPFNVKFPSKIEYTSVFNNKIIIGSSEGVWESTLLDSGGLEAPKLKWHIPFVSYLTPISERKFLISTREDHHYIADFEKNKLATLSYTVNNINNLYVSTEHDIWLSGNDGLILLKENLFQGVNKDEINFIESIAIDDAGIVYYATSLSLYAYDPTSKVNKVVLNLPDGYFQSLVSTPDGIWVSNAFKVFLINEGKIKKEFDFGDEKRFVTSISKDSKNNIWLAIPGRKEVFMIDRSFNLHAFNVEGNNTVINTIREAKDGMYLASSGDDSFLFFKSSKDSVFRNLRHKTNFDKQSVLNVTSLAVIDDNVWLATTDGMLKYDQKTIERINLGSETKQPIRSIYPYKKDKLLIANALGFILYDITSGSYTLYNESSGLLSRTITRQGFCVDKIGRVWIGTSHGLCYSVKPLVFNKQTNEPKIIDIKLEGTHLNSFKNLQVPYGDFVSLELSSITFPESEVNFQYRILPDKQWVPVVGNMIQIPSKRSGDYTMAIRAIKNGGYDWSNILHLNYTVNRPYWEKYWFYFIVLVAISVLVIITYIIVNTRNKKINQKLQLLIDQRTKDLKVSNEELSQLNIEKNNFIGIVAHDLKSPLSQIKGFISLMKLDSKVDKAGEQYLDQMNSSVTRLNEMISKILDVDAIESKKLNLKIEAINASEIVEEIADRYIHIARKKNIKINKQITPEVFVLADTQYLQEVLDNLLSNAIKFSPFDKQVYVNLSSQLDKVQFEVKDEGPGLTEDDKKKIFGKFQRLSARPTGNEISTGLGLSIVKRFVSEMNGDVWCECNKDKGASFFVTLPKT